MGLAAQRRTAIDEVSRELFVPDTIWVKDEHAGGYLALNRADAPGRWSALVMADEPIVIQVDDGQTRPGAVGRSPTSSCSQPSIVDKMLQSTDLKFGHTVLEIGTGTGWNAALLCAQVGERGRVVSVEIDAELASAACAALEAASFPATVIVGDGAAGYPPAAPYDRVLSTAAVRWQVPPAWVEQTRPGGLVVTPWGTSFHNGTMLRLQVANDGTATGRFGGNLAFMRLRTQRGPDWVDDENLADAELTTTSLKSAEIGEAVESFDGAFAAGLHVRDCRVHIDGYTVWLSDGRSLARVAVDPGGTSHRVHQRGPRRLWHEVETAYRWWQRAGKPDHTRFGITVAADYQTVWLDVPTSTVAAAT